jgi:hypothetical protein
LKDRVGTERGVWDVIVLAVLNNPTTDLTHDLGVAKGLGNAIRPQLYDCPPSMSPLALSLLFRVLGLLVVKLFLLVKPIFQVVLRYLNPIFSLRYEVVFVDV